MYFTETELDTVVLAAISIKDFKDSSTLTFPNCFEVSDNGDIWTLCADD